jgi:branched-subunit amino acid ABC-type transport system permease component
MRSRKENKVRYKTNKKKRFYDRIKKLMFNTFTILMYLGLLAFVYLLFFSLIFEPLVLSKSYGRSDTIELAYLAITGFIIGLSYLIRQIIDYKEEQQWQKNWRLLRDVKFDLNRYSSLKRMGIDHLNKKKKKHRRPASRPTEKSN